MIPELKFDPKEFYMWEAVAQNSTNIPKINGILEDLVKREVLLEYIYKGEDKTKMPVYEINEEGEFLPARGLQSKVYHLIKDRLYDIDEAAIYALVIEVCGDKSGIIKRKIAKSHLESGMVCFHGKTKTIDDFWLRRFANPENKPLGF
jgi:hypothetical protein